MQTYPTIDLLLRHRGTLPAGVATLGVLAGAWIAIRVGWPEAAAAGLILGGLLFVLVRAALELVQLISDMLMPR